MGRPEPAEPGRPDLGPADGAGAATAPITDGPGVDVDGAMTVRGTITKTSLLFVILLVAAYAGWQATPDPRGCPTARSSTASPASPWSAS